MTSSEPTNAPASNPIDGDSPLNANCQVWEKKALPKGLYIVSTPIGNLRDISLRALDTLANVDEVWSEDTRQTQKLLNYYGLTVKQSSYNDHNAAKRRPKVIEKLKEGKSVALVSDAGTPLVSDPGWKLVVEAIEVGIEIFPIPGTSATLAGLVVSGLPTDRFLFAGFLPPKKSARQKILEELREIQTTLIFFERGSRLANTLKDIGKILGFKRKIAIARELTKLYEEVRRGTIETIIDYYSDQQTPKGEIVVLVGSAEVQSVGISKIDEALKLAMKTQTLKNAVADVSSNLGISKRECYQRALLIKEKL